MEKIALIDFDDTLVVTGPELYYACLVEGVETVLNKKVTDFRPCLTLVEFFAQFGINEYEPALKVFRQVWSKRPLRIADDVISMLDQFHNHGWETVVWTARDEVSARTSVEDSELKQYFSKIFGFRGKDCPGKPDLDPKLLNLVSGKNCVVIGDSQTDADGAKALGARFIQATWVAENTIAGDHVVAKSPLGIDCQAVV